MLSPELLVLESVPLVPFEPLALQQMPVLEAEPTVELLLSLLALLL
jgi:hypothetical protein